MKTGLISIFCFLLFLSEIACSQSTGTPNGFKIGKGVNMAIWLSQSDKRGLEREQFITEKDFQLVSDLGFDHIRLPIDEVQIWDEEGNFHKDALKLMHNALKWSLDRNMRVIVDLHIIRSHYFNAESNPLWTEPAEQDKLAKLWLQLSGELKKYPTDFVAYELMNEAVAEDHDDWNKLIAKLIKSLRTIEPDRTIIVGSNRWQGTETFPYLKIPEGDKNLILSFHHYRPFGLTHYKTEWTDLAGYNGPVHYPGEVATNEDLADFAGIKNKIMWALGNWNKERMFDEIKIPIEYAKKHGLPLYCGEFGVYHTVPKEDALRWYTDVIDIFKENNIAYSHWDYKTTFGILDKNQQPKKEVVKILTR